MKHIALKPVMAVLTGLVSLCADASDAFDRAVALLMSQNPDIVIADAENQRQIKEMQAENNLPETEVAFSKRWGHFGSQKASLEINQGFDWPGLYGARSKETSLAKAALTRLTGSRVVEKRLQIQLLIIDYIAAKKRVALAKETDSVMTELASRYDRAYELGEVNILDRNKVRVEASRAAAALMTAEHEREDAISAILAEGKDTSVTGILAEIDEFPEMPFLSEDEYERILMENDPMIEYYRLQGEIAAQNMKVARLGYLPSFTVGYGFEREDGQNFHGFNVGIGLPLFSNRHKTSSAALRKVESENALSAEIFRSTNKIRYMVADVKLLGNTLETLSEVFDTGNNFKLLRKAFEGGEINLFTYLSDLNYFSEAKADYITAAYLRAKYLAELNRLTGK